MFCLVISCWLIAFVYLLIVLLCYVAFPLEFGACRFVALWLRCIGGYELLVGWLFLLSAFGDDLLLV